MIGLKRMELNLKIALYNRNAKKVFYFINKEMDEPIIIMIIVIITIIIIIVLLCIISFTKQQEVLNKNIKLFELKYSNDKVLLKPNLIDSIWNKIIKNSLYCERFVGGQSHQFLIDDDGILWYRLSRQNIIKNSINENDLISNFENDDFKILFWDNMFKGKAKKVMNDGCNLMIQCENGEISYRKIIKHSRFGKKYENYKWKDDLINKNKWKIGKNLSHMAIFTYNKLNISLESSICLSHRGPWNGFVYNRKNKKKIYESPMVDTCGVTHLYEYLKNENKIKIYDPWFLSNVFMLENVPIGLKDIKICSSASTLFIIGKNNDNGKYESYWRVFDFDMNGFVPITIPAKTNWISMPLFPNEINNDNKWIFGGLYMNNFGLNRKQVSLWFKSKYDNEILSLKSNIDFIPSLWNYCII